MRGKVFKVIRAHETRRTSAARKWSRPGYETAKKTLITGGAGFLGSHLCERLLAEGHEVICLDNFVTGRDQNISQLQSNPLFSVIHHDVTAPIFAEVDEIYNLASPASPRDYQADPIKTTETNVLGALNVLGLSVRQHTKVFQASTSEIYGDPHVHPQPECYWGNVNPTGLRSCYDEGKRCAESLFFDFARRYQVPIKVARIFNTYGPRMRLDDGRVVSNFIVQALQGDDITIYGDGSQTRSFCYVDDLIEGFVRLMRSPDEVTGPINLGNPSEVTVRQLADLVVSMLNSRSRIIHLPLPQDDPRQRRPDINQAKRVLDWEPNVALVDGLERTTAYFEAQLAKGISLLREKVA